MAERYFHGGVPGRRIGELIRPGTDGNSRHVDGCPICQARASGQRSGIDPAPTHPDKVYVTTDREYARFYAALAGHGGLYVVRPVGELTDSTEDRFPTWTCHAAEVLVVYDRAVTLTDGQRRRLLRRWIEADAVADGWHDRYRAMSVADRRAMEERVWQQQWATARAVAAGRGDVR